MEGWIALIKKGRGTEFRSLHNIRAKVNYLSLKIKYYIEI